MVLGVAVFGLVLAGPRIGAELSLGVRPPCDRWTFRGDTSDALASAMFTGKFKPTCIN